MSANPWKSIRESAPFVLDEDKPFVDAYNERCPPESRYWINTSYTPEPRLGPVDAPIMVLQANPSYDPKMSSGARDREQIRLELESLRNDRSPHLGVLSESQWWRRSTGGLAKAVGREHLAAHMCSVEFFPYRSLSFGHSHIRLPSQQYTIALVRRALQDGRLIVLTRTADVWFGAIPELLAARGRNVVHAVNPRRTFISPGNLTDNGYDKILKRLGKV